MFTSLHPGPVVTNLYLRALLSVHQWLTLSQAPYFLGAERLYPPSAAESGISMSQAFFGFVGDFLGLGRVTAEELIKSRYLNSKLVNLQTV